MQRVIVTVKRQNEARVRDLEVPTDIAAAQLAQTIAHTLNWDINLAGAATQYQIEAHIAGRPGRILPPDETLANAGVWDGAWLVLMPQGAARSTIPTQSPGAVAPATPTGVAGPTTGQFRSLGIDLQVKPDQSAEQKDAPPGSEWKQLD